MKQGFEFPIHNEFIIRNGQGRLGFNFCPPHFYPRLLILHPIPSLCSIRGISLVSIPNSTILDTGLLPHSYSFSFFFLFLFSKIVFRKYTLTILFINIIIWQCEKYKNHIILIKVSNPIRRLSWFFSGTGCATISSCPNPWDWVFYGTPIEMLGWWWDGSALTFRMVIHSNI